jgi:N-acetylglucosaminyldiphosphoundecaprenol N-acetyl-beta-D-mannosaminyltransferase
MLSRVNILGVGVSAINMDLALDTIDQWCRHRERHYICVTTVHGVIESQRDERLREIHNTAGLVTPDGMPFVWLLKLHGHDHVDRVYGPDLMLAVFQVSRARGYKHFLYGASETALMRLQMNLERRFPDVPIVGSHSPPFRPLTKEEDRQIVEMINESGADIVWVGLSTPKQEHWMAEHRDRLQAPVLIGVGAAFDFHAGLTRQAPRFIQRAGFEWFFRLAMEPRRLWRRYLTIIPPFVFLILCQEIGIKRYSIPNGRKLSD